jgi:hypothetical protein
LQYSLIDLGKLQWRMLGMQRHRRVVTEHSARSRVRQRGRRLVYRMAAGRRHGGSRFQGHRGAGGSGRGT